MTDKPSERVSARPPVPSSAPPTDDIDAEWGTDDIPAPAPLPKASVAPAPAPSVAPARASSPAPRIPTPIPRPSSAPRIPTPLPRPSSAPLGVTTDALRKQTLLGIAPVLSASTADTAVAAPELPEPPSAPVHAEVEPARAPLVVPAASDSPRKQTLLGIAPVLPEPPPGAPLESDGSQAAPAAVATDAPTTLDVESPAAAGKPVISWPPPQPSSAKVEEALEPSPKPARPGWLLPLGVAAALGLAVFGWQQLRRAPNGAPPPVAAAPAPRAEATPPAEATPSAEAAPSKETPGAEGAPAASTDALSSSAPPSPEPPAAEAAPSGDVVRVHIKSDPPGARLFWRGKAVGTTPFVLELAPGEKHAYEMGLPGYNTRKVVVDGSKPEVSVGLKPEPGTVAGGNRRKP